MASPTDDISQRRIKDAKSARAVYETYRRNDGPRVKQMASVRNQIDGGRPFDPAQLARNGEDWTTNVNFRDAESSYNRTYLPYWKMVHDVPNKIAATVELNTPKADTMGKAVAECFDLFLDDWGADYFFQFMLSAGDFVKFGPGYVMWPDGDRKSPSPRFKHARTEYVKLPKRAKANIADWEISAVEGEMTVSELWSKIRNRGATNRSNYVGWKSDMVKKAIALCMKQDATQCDGANWTKIQDNIVSNDLAAAEEGAPLEIVRMYVRGHDGKIAYYVFSKSELVPDFLCASEDYADEFKHCIGGLFYDVGSGGLVHSIKGFGIKNYYFSILQNRMKSRMMDAATLSMAFNFQREDDGASESPPVENYGAINVFPRGLKQVPIYPQIGATQSVIQLLANNAAENNYIYRDSSKDIAETQTARQAVILANLSEEIGSATASIYLAQVGENIFAECVRRLLVPGSRDPDAVKFRQRLQARGVPLKVIPMLGDAVRIKTGASPGTAGAALRDLVFKELLGLSNMPGVNRRWILENYIANKLGTQAVSKALLPEGQNSEPAQRREAMIENGHFGQGMSLPVDPADAHFEHAEEHLKPLEQIIAQYKANAGKVAPEALVALQTALPHVAQHFDFLKQDETQTDNYKALYPHFSQVQSIAAGIFANLLKQQQRGKVAA
jgi:hypothetical protein